MQYARVEADRLGVDAGDPDHGVGLAVAVAASHVLAATELLDDDFLGLVVLDDLADDAGPFEDGGADRGGTVATGHPITVRCSTNSTSARSNRPHNSTASDGKKTANT